MPAFGMVDLQKINNVLVHYIQNRQKEKTPVSSFIALTRFSSLYTE